MGRNSIYYIYYINTGIQIGWQARSRPRRYTPGAKKGVYAISRNGTEPARNIKQDAKTRNDGF